MSEQLAMSMEHGLGFGPFELYPLQKLLLEDGASVEVGSRALDLLTLLVRRPGEVISREALIAAAWPDVIVDDVSLRVHISALRHALGDGVGERRFIKTVPGRGYSFVEPVRTLAAHRSRATRPPTAWPASVRRIVGRDDLIATLEADLRRERLVTLTGPAGIGKSTVAAEVGRRVASSYSDGIAVVDLAPVKDPRGIPMTLQISVGLSDLGTPTLESIAAGLSDRCMLLVFDNCEHLVESVAKTVWDLVDRAKGVQVISTSREPLGVLGEKLRRVEPLSLPRTDVNQTAAEIRSYSAVELFEHRARSALDRFEIEEANANIVADICRRLDGVPFAIELAASHVDAFGLSDIRAQLDARAAFLDAGAPGAAPRQQRTIRDALAWSYDLLSDDERAMLRRLSVFAGVFSLADATDLFGSSQWRGVMQGLRGLSSKSLLSVDVGGLEARYRLLDMTRLFAGERLSEEDDEQVWRQRHADLIKARLDTWTAEAAPAEAPDPAIAARYIEDLNGALDWAYADPQEAERAVTLTLAAVPLWAYLSLHFECRRRTEHALRSMRGRTLSGAQDVALRAAFGSAVLYGEGPGPAAIAAVRQALDAARAIGDREHELRALWSLVSCATNAGDYNVALSMAQAFAEAAALSPDQDDHLVGQRMLGLAYYYRGQFGEALHHTEAMLSEYVAPSDGRDIRRYHVEQRILAEGVRSTVLWHLGFPDQARSAGERRLGAAQRLGHPLTLTYVLATHINDLLSLYADVEGARGCLRQLDQQAKRFPWSPAKTFLDTLGDMFETGFGEVHEGVARLETALRQQRRAGPRAGMTNAFGFLARGYRQLGDLRSAHESIQLGLEHGRTHGELWCIAELTRIKGEIARDAGDIDGAIECLETAIGESREQGALGWELRAATDLARLWSERGRTREAAELLNRIYSQFSEGFETADLQAASALLHSLTT